MRSVLRALLLSAALTTSAAAQNAVPMQSKPLDPANIDRSVSACTDFYQFANGGWVKRNPIPAAYSRWGSFDQLQEANQSNLLTILRAAAASGNPQASADLRKLGTYYSTCMVSVGAVPARIKPIKSELDRINAIRNRAQLEAEIARLHYRGVPLLLGFGAQQDFKNSTSVIAGITQGGLTLPDRDYYLNTEKRYVDIRTNYVDHITRMLQLIGQTPAQAAADAQKVMSIETALAKPAMTRVQMRDPNANYHRMTAAELAVARLVADGLTNKEVAERLFVSPHTVNSHLRHVFLKLGITSRVELARVAHDYEIA